MTSAKVVLVHGMWMPGEEMMLMKLRLEKDYGFDTELFSYPSVKGTLDENAALLSEFVSDLNSDEVHLVGHSLGGVVSLRMLAQQPDAPTGRVVCLGSPLCGSRAADLVTQHDWGNSVLGRSVVDGVVEDAANEWAAKVTAEREVGSIAGTKPVGLGRLFAEFREPSDGTIAVSETRLPGLRDHLLIAINHTGLVLSARVVKQVAAFLKDGAFKR